MNTISHPSLVYNERTITRSKPSVIAIWKRFIAWAESQQYNRLLWLSISLAGHGCIFTIAAISTVLLTGNNFVLYVMAFLPMVLVIIVNLAALPTKITIPVLCLSLLVDIVVISIAILQYLG